MNETTVSIASRVGEAGVSGVAASATPWLDDPTLFDLLLAEVELTGDVALETPAEETSTSESVSDTFVESVGKLSDTVLVRSQPAVLPDPETPPDMSGEGSNAVPGYGAFGPRTPLTPFMASDGIGEGEMPLSAREAWPDEHSELGDSEAFPDDLVDSIQDGVVTEGDPAADSVDPSGVDPSRDAHRATGESQADTARRLSSAESARTEPPGGLPRHSLEGIDLAKFDVRRIAVQVETPEHASPGPGVANPAADLGDRPNPKPMHAATRVLEVPGADRRSANASDVLASVFRPEEGIESADAGVPTEADGNPGPDGLEPAVDRRYAGIFGDRVNSELQWHSTRVDRPARRSESPDPDFPGHAPDTVSDEVRLTGDVRQESRETARPGADRMVAPPQPPKPVEQPTFNPDPARRVVMTVGEAESEVQVLVHERNGNVSIRFDAPNAVRTHLEASAHQLVESMTREHLSLAGMTFGETGAGDSRNGEPRHEPRPQPAKSGASPGATTVDFVPTFEFSHTDSRIRLRA